MMVMGHLGQAINLGVERFTKQSTSIRSPGLLPQSKAHLSWFFFHTVCSVTVFACHFQIHLGVLVIFGGNLIEKRLFRYNKGK